MPCVALPACSLPHDTMRSLAFPPVLSLPVASSATGKTFCRLPFACRATDIINRPSSQGLLRGTSNLGDVTITAIAGLVDVRKGLSFDFDAGQLQAPASFGCGVGAQTSGGLTHVSTCQEASKWIGNPLNLRGSPLDYTMLLVGSWPMILGRKMSESQLLSWQGL